MLETLINASRFVLVDDDQPLEQPPSAHCPLHKELRVTGVCVQQPYKLVFVDRVADYF